MSKIKALKNALSGLELPSKIWTAEGKKMILDFSIDGERIVLEAKLDNDQWDFYIFARVLKSKDFLFNSFLKGQLLDIDLEHAVAWGSGRGVFLLQGLVDSDEAYQKIHDLFLAGTAHVQKLMEGNQSEDMVQSETDKEWIEKIEKGELGGYKVANKIPEEFRSLPVLIAAAKKSPGSTLDFAGEHAGNPKLIRTILEKSPRSLKDLKDFWTDKEMLIFVFSQNVAQVGQLYLNGDILIDNATAAEIRPDLEPLFQAALQEAQEAYQESKAEKEELEALFTYHNSSKDTLAQVLQTIAYFDTIVEGTGESRNDSTAALENAIREDSFDDLEDLNWDEVNVAQIVFSIVSEKDKKDAHLGGDQGAIWFRLLQKIAATNKTWGAAVIYKLQPNLFFGVWGGDAWAPRVMWNGTVLIRNHHRVIGLHFEGIVLLSEEDLAQALEDFDRVDPNNKWGVTAKDGQIIEVQSSADINLYGNNAVGLMDQDSLEGSNILSYSLLEDAFDNSRAGVALRFFKKGVIVYSTSRENDEFDFALEQLNVFNPDMGEADLSAVCAVNIDAHQDYQEAYKAFSNSEYEFYQDALYYPFENAVEDLTYQEEFTMEELAEEKFELLDKTLMSLLKEQFMHHSFWTVRRQFNWQQQIFGNQEEQSFDYARNPKAFVERMQEEENQLVLYLNYLNVESKDDLYNLGEYHDVFDVLESAGADTFNAKREIFIPSGNEGEEGKWVSMDEHLDEYIDRMEELVDAEMDGDWDEAGELGDGNCIRFFFSMDNNWLLNLRNIGMQISEELEDVSYPVYGMRLEVPVMGLVQNFEGGDLDSGNMHS